jgi:predicted amidohydrolase YtcJ
MRDSQLDLNDCDTVIFGGSVLAMDGVTPAQEAIVLSGGRVRAIGSRADMVSLAGKGARHVDVDGATVMPGLIDTHPHLMHFAARASHMVDITDVRNHDQIVDRIRAKAAVTPPGEWIVATPVGEPHYFIRRSWRDLEERRMPDRWVLDKATTAHPVFIEAWGPTTPNVCAFNSPALDKMGITDFIPDRVCDVWIEKDDRGRVSGILRGAVNNYYSFDPYWTQLQLKLPGPAQWELFESTRGAMAAANRQGITAIYEAHNMRPDHVRTYGRLREQDRLTLRVMAATESESYAYPPFRPLSMDAFGKNLEIGLSLIELDDPFFRVTGVSFSPGGPLGPGTLRMHEPYRGPFGEPTRGITFLSREKQDFFIAFCAKQGVRANFVVAGFRDTDDVIEGLEKIAVEFDIRDRRWLIQHALVINEHQIRRLLDFGCQMTTSMSFSWGKGDLYGERIGRHIWKDQVPLKRLLRMGMTVGCGSDWGPKNPWELIQLAQTHEFAGSGHRNDTPDHAVTREESLLTWTRDAAKVLHWDELGCLLPGRQADLVVVDRNPLTCDLSDVPSTQVQLTVVGGQVVHRDAAAPAIG